MKELVRQLITGLLSVLLIFGPITALVMVSESTEEEVTAVVDTVNGGYITLVDTNGEAWVWECESGERAYHVGEEVTIIFDTLGTEDIYDDEIMEIRRG